MNVKLTIIVWYYFKIDCESFMMRVCVCALALICIWVALVLWNIWIRFEFFCIHLWHYSILADPHTLPTRPLLRSIWCIYLFLNSNYSIGVFVMLNYCRGDMAVMTSFCDLSHCSTSRLYSFQSLYRTCLLSVNVRMRMNFCNNSMWKTKFNYLSILYL